MANEIEKAIEYEVSRLVDILTEDGIIAGVRFVDHTRDAMHRVARVAARERFPAGPDPKSDGNPLGIIEPLPEYEISYSPRHLSGIIDAVMRSAYRLGRGDDARPAAAEVA